MLANLEAKLAPEATLGRMVVGLAGSAGMLNMGLARSGPSRLMDGSSSPPSASTRSTSRGMLPTLVALAMNQGVAAGAKALTPSLLSKSGIVMEFGRRVSVPAPQAVESVDGIVMLP